MRLSSLHHIALVSFLAAAAMACTEAPPEEVIETALEQENGGLDTSDEAPMFGDEAAFAAASLEKESAGADPTASDPEVVQLRERPGVGQHRLMILWGQLPPDRNAEAHVWDGRLALNRGVVIVRREVGFEDGTDAVLPREQRSTVGFTSSTRPFADGLVLEILDPEPTSATPLVLTYTARGGGDALRFDLGALAAGPISYDVGTGGDQMVASALRADDACDHGFMRGRWHQVRASLGRFMGVVSDADGAPVGHLRGIWGARQNGAQVMFAKYIALDGSFRGIVNGTYDDGGFRGRWIISTGDHGVVQGRYRESAPGAEVGGGFMGRWAETSCAAGL